MVPNTEAEAGKHASSASKLMIAIDRFDILIPRRNRSQVPVFSSPNNKSASLPDRKRAKEFATQPEQLAPLLEQALRQRQCANRPRTNSAVTYFSALGCALDEGRTAISMRRKAGNCEHNRNQLNLAVAHCRWRKIGVRGNCGSAPQMPGSAAIHGTLSVIGRRGESRFRFWRGRMMVVLVHRTIAVVHCHRVAGNCFAGSRTRRRHHRRKHG
jgi:hypothetical protein